MKPRDRLIPAIASRQRARSRVRMITLMTGAAGLATAGYIAYHLPAPPSRTAGTGRTPGAATVAPATSAPTAPRYGDGEAEGDDGGRAVAPTTAPGPAPAASHATSGGS